jgi:hypothetical protein
MKQITGPKVLLRISQPINLRCVHLPVAMKTKRTGTGIVSTSRTVIGNFRPILLAVLRIQDVEPGS